MDKARHDDFPGRFREILSDPLNLLIRRHPEAGRVTEGLVTLHNGHRVPVAGDGAYYEAFSEILSLNRGVHEPLEEFVFQEVIGRLSLAPVMLELGAYWAHYAMWLKQVRPQAAIHMIEPDPLRAAAGRANLARNGYAGTVSEAFIGAGAGETTLDGWMAAAGLTHLDILHSDIQGYEEQMLDGAGMALGARRVGYWFISTHGQALHGRIVTRLADAGYRVEVSSDPDHETTSFDGFVLAVHPDLPPVWRGPPPLGRVALEGADPREILARLSGLLQSP